jgi:hypothetical protein
MIPPPQLVPEDRESVRGRHLASPDSDVSSDQPVGEERVGIDVWRSASWLRRLEPVDAPFMLLTL